MRETPTSQSSRRLARLRPIASAFAVTLICVATGSSRIAQPSFAITNGGSIVALGVPLTETFDTLASTGTGITWTDNSTVPGWYSTRASYNRAQGRRTLAPSIASASPAPIPSPTVRWARSHREVPARSSMPPG